MGVQLGLRPGELLGLAWSDVDSGPGVIRVRASLKRAIGPAAGAKRADLKTTASHRTLAMPAAVCSVLLALRKQQAADRLALGGHYADNGLVFCDSAGRPRWGQAVSAQFKAICKQAGIGEDWQPRELRHTFVSQLSHGGASIEAIADAAGHANSNVTKIVYRHQLADVLTTTATVMDQIYRAGGTA
jgi:integrase